MKNNNISTTHQDNRNDTDGDRIYKFERTEDISNDCWKKKYQYILCTILIGTGINEIPLSAKFVFEFSGGGLLIAIFCFSLIMGLPLIYMESFLGKFTGLTNCQMYRMAPIFFGVSFTIFILNLLYQPFSVTDESQVVVSLLNVIVRPETNTKCIENGTGCYDYKINGPIQNDTCTYYDLSAICTTHGKIRYPSQFNYWKTYRDPNSESYPHSELLTAVAITWLLILFALLKPLQVLGKIIQAAFVVHFLLLTSILLIVSEKDGSTDGLHVLVTLSAKNFHFNQVPTAIWYSVSRLGLIVPSGFMTNSAYTTFSNNIAIQCIITIIISIIILGYYLLIFFMVCGVLAKATGINIEAMLIRDKGLFMTIIPEVLVYLGMPNTIIILFYGSLWIFETMKIAFYVHLLILNLYDYFPTMKSFSTYISVTSTIILGLMSVSACEKRFSTTFIPLLWQLYLIKISSLGIALEATMVFYVYGVTRLSNDIQFMFGLQPPKFWIIMWYTIPIISWILIFLSAEEENLLGKAVYYGFICIIISITCLHILFNIGSPNMLLQLLKPQFYWGPPNRTLRMDRKLYNPSMYIRSRRVYNKKQIISKPSGERRQVIMSEFSKEVLVEFTKRNDIMDDKDFFQYIGAVANDKADHKILEENTRELDMLTTQKVFL